MARTLLEASASETAPSGCVPLTGGEASATSASCMLVTGGDEAGREMENTFNDVKRDGVVGARFTDTWRQDKSKNSGARLLIGAHSVEHSRGWNARPRRQRSEEAANERDDSRDVVGKRHAEFVTEEGGGDHAPGNGFAVLEAGVSGQPLKGVGEGVTEIE